MQGITERTTETGIRVVEIDFEANPEKRSPEWEIEARRGYTSESAFRREMRRDRTVASGIGIYSEEFSRSAHVAPEPLAPKPGSPMVFGFDFGLTPACVWARVLAWGGLRVFRETVTWDGRGDPKTQGSDRLAEKVDLARRREYPECTLETVYCDPSGWDRGERDERTCVSGLQERFGAEVNILPGPKTFEARRSPMRRMLGRIRQGEPWIWISPTCTMLIQALSGAYRYRSSGEGGNMVLSTQPDKNAWSHIAEAFEYLVGGLYGVLEPDEELPETIYQERSALRAGIY